MNRREFMRGAVGCVLAFAAPSLVTDPGDPADIVWARSSLISGAMLAVASPESLKRWMAWERVALETEATEQYGRPIRFEVIDEDGEWLRPEPGLDAKYILWRERLDLHPYWKTRLGT